MIAILARNRGRSSFRSETLSEKLQANKSPNDRRRIGERSVRGRRDVITKPEGRR